MGRVKEAFDALTVRAKSPDGRVIGTLSGRSRMRIDFDDADSYYDYPKESELATQLRLVVDALLDGQRGAQRHILHERTRLRVKDRPHWHSGARKFRAEHDSITALGDSKSDYVSISFTGLSEAEVVIAPGTFDALDVKEFVAEVGSAIENLWEDWFDQLWELQHRHWHGGK